jgi:superoxide dismutase, Fe-Mn family
MSISRRQMFSSLLAGFGGITLLSSSGCSPATPIFRMTVSPPDFVSPYPHELTPLPYAYDALEPVIDEETMRLHHTRHHQTYIDRINEAIGQYPGLFERPLIELLSNLTEVPPAIRTAVRNHGGGHLNHSMFWRLLAPGGGGSPAGELASAINETFGSFENFRTAFNQAANGLFGSGWAWLVVAGPDGPLEIVQMPDQDNPVMFGQKPVLGIDLWEHAYYLNYRNRRQEYVENWWNVVNWQQAEENFTADPGWRPGIPAPRI